MERLNGQQLKYQVPFLRELKKKRMKIQRSIFSYGFRLKEIFTGNFYLVVS